MVAEQSPTVVDARRRFRERRVDDRSKPRRDNL